MPLTARMSSTESAVLISICLTAVTLNTMLFYLVYHERQLQTVFNVFILNLSTADILVSVNVFVGVVWLLIRSEDDFADGTSACKVTGFVNILCFVASCMSLAMVSINRYFLIVKWNVYAQIFTRQRCIAYIGCVWLFSISLVVPPLVGWSRYVLHHNKSICFADWKASWSYMFFMIGVCFCGPIFATGFSLWRIYSKHRVVSKTVQPEGLTLPNGNNQLGRSTATFGPVETKITLSVCIIFFAFIAAWGPFVVVMLLNTVGDHHVARWAEFGAYALGTLNSLINPIVYLLLNRHFRRAFSKHVYSCTKREASGDN